MIIYSLYHDESMAYPEAGAPFRPGEAYPEYPFGADCASPNVNAIYAGVRETLRLAGLDAESYGTAAWNPLGAYIEPGMCVLVKPNLVMHENPTGNGTDCLYTHPSVVAAVIDYVVVALKGKGTVMLADAPMQSCNFDALVGQSGLSELVSWYRSRGVDIELKDMRGLKSVSTAAGLEQELVEDAAGKVIDLGTDSCFAGLPKERIDGLRITNYDPAELKRHHTQDRHEYYVSSCLLDADVVVNLPKAKTHRKAGVTGALKNMVGVNVRKEYLPHHSNGSAAEGCDEYEGANLFKRLMDDALDAGNSMLAQGPSCARRILAYLARGFRFLGKRTAPDAYTEGSWFGNDTIWRTVLDLNKIVFFADRDGVMRDEPQRRMVVLCDMVTVGQGEGPLLPEPGEWHMLAFSDDPCVHDVAMTRMMGTDPSIITTVGNALVYDGPYAWRDAGGELPACRSNDPAFDGVRVDGLNEDMRYKAKPTSGWAARFAREVHIA